MDGLVDMILWYSMKPILFSMVHLNKDNSKVKSIEIITLFPSCPDQWTLINQTYIQLHKKLSTLIFINYTKQDLKTHIIAFTLEKGCTTFHGP